MFTRIRPSMMAYMIAPSVVKSERPGFRPLIIRADSIMATQPSPGMPSVSRGDEGRTADSVVGRLRRRNALHRTVAELFRVFGHILRSVVGEPRGLRRTRARYDTKHRNR